MYRSKLTTPETEWFFKAILSLKTEEDCARFFEDVATIGEVQAMAQRLHVAKLLNDGCKYSDVAGHRRLHRHHIPGEPLPHLRGGRIQAGSGQAGEVTVLSAYVSRCTFFVKNTCIISADWL